MTTNELIIAIIWGLTPTVLVGVIFYIVFRAVLHSDRNERKAQARIEAAERARFERKYGASPKPAQDAPNGGPSADVDTKA